MKKTLATIIEPNTNKGGSYSWRQIMFDTELIQLAIKSSSIFVGNYREQVNFCIRESRSRMQAKLKVMPPRRGFASPS